MKFLLITKEGEMEEAARKGLTPYEVDIYGDWHTALQNTAGIDMMFVDLLSTLKEPHKISGYEDFAMAKMAHAEACGVPLVLIAPPDDYELDFMTGWPDFVFGHIRRPVSDKIFRRASTWI